MKMTTKLLMTCMTLTGVLAQASSATWWDDASLVPAKKFAAEHPEQIELAEKNMAKTLGLAEIKGEAKNETKSDTKSEIKSDSKKEEKNEAKSDSYSSDALLKSLADAWTQKVEFSNAANQEGWIESHIASIYQIETQARVQEFGAKASRHCIKELPVDNSGKKEKLNSIKLFVEHYLDALNEAEQAHNVTLPIRHTITLIVEQIRIKEEAAAAEKEKLKQKPAPIPSSSPSPLTSPYPLVSPSPEATPYAQGSPLPVVSPVPAAYPSAIPSAHPSSVPAPEVYVDLAPQVLPSTVPSAPKSQTHYKSKAKSKIKAPKAVPSPKADLYEQL